MLKIYESRVEIALDSMTGHFNIISVGKKVHLAEYAGKYLDIFPIPESKSDKI